MDYSSTDTEESTNESPRRGDEEKYHERSIYKAPFRLVITPYIHPNSATFAKKKF